MFDNATDQAAQRVKEAAAASRASLLDFGTQALRLFNGWRDVERRSVEAMLGRMGLQRRQSAARPVLWFAAGAVAGGCVAVVLAPMAAEGLRAAIERLRHARDRVEKTATRAPKQHVGNGEVHESA